ncbi:MAG: exodeoxyribonuclease V subunit gamma [Solirubrobacteraceae bacterium]|nr:exodeoxyribonuclease V subunit gamma [Solirubrobacteraceae bacterium]
MRRILRDQWSWRGGLTLDELRYRPELADATAGPITGPPVRHWPLLVSATDALALVAATGVDERRSFNAAVLWVILHERTGSYHATVPRHDPTVARIMGRLRGGDDGRPDPEAVRDAQDALEAAGLLDVAPTRIGVLRPCGPGPDELRAASDALDAIEQDDEWQAFEARAWQLSRRLIADGPAARRFHQLSSYGRTRVTISAPDPAFEDPHRLYACGLSTLPPLHLAFGFSHDEIHGVRGGIALAGASYDRPDLPPGPGASGGPVLVAAYEVAARLLGRAEGRNAVRRAVRGTVVWLLALEATGGRLGRFETTKAELSTGFARTVGLDATADHRSTVRQLLGDLERVGALATVRGPRSLTVDVLGVEPPADDDVRHFARQWALWRAGVGADHRDEVGPGLGLAHRHLQRVRDVWVELLDRRRVRVEILPGPPEAPPVAG